MNWGGFGPSLATVARAAAALLPWSSIASSPKATNTTQQGELPVRVSTESRCGQETCSCSAGTATPSNLPPNDTELIILVRSKGTRIRIMVGEQ